MSKNEDYTYQVKEMSPFHFVVQKFEDFGDPVPDEYRVTLSNRSAPWCDCMGMLHFSGIEEEHKHIKLVRAYLDIMGEDKRIGAKFILHLAKGAGKGGHTIETIID